MIFAIPILGILFAGYKEWLEFKAEHRALETTPREVETQLRTLQDRLSALEQEQDALQERVQNLETIVTSEAWIAGHDGNEKPTLEDAEVDALALPTDRDADDTAATTAEIARRLRGQ
jgi:peptidoglycan hydrolase CwlO-like protein